MVTDRRSCAAGEQEFARRQEILGAFGSGQFSPEILRADSWTKTGGDADGGCRSSSGFSSQGIGRKTGELHGHAARDQRKSFAGGGRRVCEQTASWKIAGRSSSHDRARSRA